MFIAAVLSLMLAQGEGEVTKVWYLNNPGNVGEPRVMLQTRLDPLPKAKVSPMHKWEFPFLASGFGRTIDSNGTHSLRLRVYHQINRELNEPAPFVARTLMRLWDYNYQRLRLDHHEAYNNRVVDVYLCWGGKPGGEQRFDIDREGDRERKVNTIYIYQLESFTQPIEMLREVAHEYGHATLPPVGGFKTPEDWANGYLGEKLFLKHLRGELAARRLGPEDALMATEADLEKWVGENVDPILLAAAKRGPDARLLRLTGSAAMNHYLGLALYMNEVLPPAVFTRSITIIGSTKARDYPPAAVRALAEPDSVKLTIPTALRNKSIWIPLGKGKLKGAAVLQKKGDWALVKTAASSLTVINR